MFKMLFAVDALPAHEVDWGADEAIYSPVLKELVLRGITKMAAKIAAVRGVLEDNCTAITLLVVIRKTDDLEDILEIVPEDSAEGGPLGQQLGGKPCMTTGTGKVSGK